ncbi:MAG: rhodanese-like domain-containing protein [Gammaproteobacteria bacterium]
MTQIAAGKPIVRTLRRLLVCLLAALPLVAGCAHRAVDPNLAKAQEGWERVENGALLIDVRSEAEFESGAIPGAVNIPYDDTDALAAAIGSDRDRPVVMYCGSGRRVGIAIEALEERGYRNLFNATGYEALQSAMQP